MNSESNSKDIGNMNLKRKPPSSARPRSAASTPPPADDGTDAPRPARQDQEGEPVRKITWKPPLTSRPRSAESPRPESGTAPAVLDPARQDQEGESVRMITRRPPLSTRPRSSEAPRPESGTAPIATGSAPQARQQGADEQRGGPAPDASRSVRRGEPAPPHHAPAPDLERKVTRLLKAEDEAEFVDGVFDRMDGALVELGALLGELEGDGRVGTAYRLALAARLDLIQRVDLEEWKTVLLEDLDEDEG